MKSKKKKDQKIDLTGLTIEVEYYTSKLILKVNKGSTLNSYFKNRILYSKMCPYKYIYYNCTILLSTSNFSYQRPGQNFSLYVNHNLIKSIKTI